MDELEKSASVRLNGKVDNDSQRTLCTPCQWLIVMCGSIKHKVADLMVLSEFHSDVGALRNSSKQRFSRFRLFVISLWITKIMKFRLLNWNPHPILRQIDA